MSEENQITNTEEIQEKTFTQNEVNELIESRLARAKKQMPSREELEEFKNWKNSQKTETERLAQREKEFHELMTERENIRRENVILRMGINNDDADYVLYKVSKLEGDFEENLKSFLAENPKYTATKAGSLNTGVVISKTIKNSEEDGAISILKSKFPKVFRSE